jgi:hypothetical protein
VRCPARPKRLPLRQATVRTLARLTRHIHAHGKGRGGVILHQMTSTIECIGVRADLRALICLYLVVKRPCAIGRGVDGQAGGRDGPARTVQRQPEVHVLNTSTHTIDFWIMRAMTTIAMTTGGPEALICKSRELGYTVLLAPLTWK